MSGAKMICDWCHEEVGDGHVHFPLNEKGKCEIRLPNPTTGASATDTNDQVVYLGSKKLADLMYEVKKEILSMIVSHEDMKGSVSTANLLINQSNATMQFCITLMQSTMEGQDYAFTQMMKEKSVQVN